MCRCSIQRLCFALPVSLVTPVPHCTALHCTALHRTPLHCTALHCTVAAGLPGQSGPALLPAGGGPLRLLRLLPRPPVLPLPRPGRHGGLDTVGPRLALAVPGSVTGAATLQIREVWLLLVALCATQYIREMDRTFFFGLRTTHWVTRAK